MKNTKKIMSLVCTIGMSLPLVAMEGLGGSYVEPPILGKARTAAQWTTGIFKDCALGRKGYLNKKRKETTIEVVRIDKDYNRLLLTAGGLGAGILLVPSAVSAAVSAAGRWLKSPVRFALTAVITAAAWMHMQDPHFLESRWFAAKNSS